MDGLHRCIKMTGERRSGMKKIEMYMAAALLSVGMSGIGAISSQAGYPAIMVGNNCLTGKNNFSFGQPNGNSCKNWQSILSGLTGYCPTTYGNNNGCNNNVNYDFSCIFNSNCDDNEYFPGQRPGESKPEINKPENNNRPEQNKPDNNKPEQNKPDNNGPEQNKPDNNKPGQTLPGENTTTDAYVQQVIRLVNEERASAGLAPLTESAAVSKAAAVRAKETTQSFSHTRPDGSGFSTVLKQNGISFTTAGENIAYGQRSPQEVMNTWMNSSGHRANILSSSYTTIGVGCYQGSNGTLYWTQLFTR